MSVRRDFSQHMEGRNDFGAETLANRGVWEYMVNGVCQGEYLISESEDKCAFIGTSDNGDTVHIGIGVKQSRTKYEFLSTVLSNPHSPPVISLIVAEKLGSELILMSRKGQSSDAEEEAKDIRWVPSGYQYTLSLVTRLYSTVATVLKNHQHYGDLSGIWEWRDLESTGDSVVVPVYYMLVHIPNSSIFTSPFAKATEHIVDLVLEVVVNVADGWSEVGVAKFYRSGEGRKKGILRGRADMIRCSMSEQGNAAKNLRFRPRVLYVDGSEIKDLEERRVWLKTSGNVNTQPSDVPQTLHDPKDPASIPVVSQDQHVAIKAMLEKLVPSFFTMIKACDTSRARKLLLEMEPEVRKAFLNSAGPDLTEFAHFTPLMLASRWSLPELSKFLVAQGADVRGTVEFEGRQTNALHHAILCAHQGVNAGWESVKYLVEKCRMEVDLLAIEWASPHLRQKKDSKPKFPEEVAYLWTKVAPRARKEFKEAIAAAYLRLGSLNQEVAPTMRLVPEPTLKQTTPRPQAEPQVASKTVSSNWRNMQNVQVSSTIPAVAVVEPVVRASLQPQQPVLQSSVPEPKRYVPPALRHAKPETALKQHVSKGNAKLGGNAFKSHKFPVKVSGKPVVNDRNKQRANPLAPTVKYDSSSDRSNWGIRLISSH